jgi:hypothetical protein
MHKADYNNLVFLHRPVSDSIVFLRSIFITLPSTVARRANSNHPFFRIFAPPIWFFFHSHIISPPFISPLLAQNWANGIAQYITITYMRPLSLAALSCCDGAEGCGQGLRSLLFTLTRKYAPMRVWKKYINIQQCTPSNHPPCTLAHLGMFSVFFIYWRLTSVKHSWSS